MCSDQGKNKSEQCTKMGYDPSSHCTLQSSWVLSTYRISVCIAMGLNKSKMSCDMSSCPSCVLKTSWKLLILKPSYKLWYIGYKKDWRVPWHRENCILERSVINRNNISLLKMSQLVSPCVEVTSTSWHCTAPSIVIILPAKLILHMCINWCQTISILEWQSC